MTITIDRPPLEEPVDDVTRRELIAAAALLAVTGCGSESEDEDPADTRTIRTDRGPVEVPLRPQRIACADFYGAFQVVDLGLKPVGISGGSAPIEPYESKLAGVAKVGDYTEPNVERVAAVRPDLVLRTIDTSDELYRQLTRVAPTVEISFEQLSLTEVTTRVGKALGRERQAAELLDRYRRRAGEIRAAHGELLERTRWTALGPAEPGQWFLYSSAWTDTAVLEAAGVRLASAAAAQQEPAKPYSLERLGMVEDSDVIVIPADEQGRPDPTMDEIRGSVVWKRLPAVRRGHAFPLPPGTSSLGMAFPLLDGLERVLDSLGR